MFKKFAVSAFALSMTATAGSAATVGACGVGSGLECLAENGTVYYGPSGDKEANVEAAITDALSLATTIDLLLLGKSDDSGTAFTGDFSGQDGTWFAPVGVMVDYVTVKAGNEGYTIYDVNGANSGSWTTIGILNGGGNQPNLSHLSFWSGGETHTPPPSSVPLPAGAALLLTALGALGLARRKRS